MIQILGLRTFEVYGKTETAVTMQERKWRAESVPYLLANYETIIEQIPPEERYNLFWTLAHVEEGKGRKFISQEIMPFDIDGIDVERKEEYIDAVLPVLGITREECAVLFTGHGLHIYIQMDEPFDDSGTFKELRYLYKGLIKRMNKALQDNYLIGDCDSDMWSAGRMGRMPLTMNQKPEKTDAMVAVLVNNMTPIHFDLVERAPEVQVDVTEQVSPKALARMPKPDTEGILDGCVFLKYCKNNQDKVPEPQWYAMLSILGRLDNGNDLCHEYSRDYHKYDEQQTDYKIEQCMLSSGPRTCENINDMWGGCSACVHNGDIKSPILIKGKDHIATRDAGFRNLKINKDGTVTAGKPNYEDMIKFFKEEHEYFTVIETRQTWIFDKSHWRPMETLEVEAFAEKILDPSPNVSETKEFVSKVKRSRLKKLDFFDNEGLMNLENGVLDIGTMELRPHSTAYGFRYVIPFPYDVNAPCDRFDLFMKEVTLDDQELIDLLLEYLGYCLSGVPAWRGEKAMILVGEGSNGKSVLLDVIRFLAGKDSYASISMADVAKEQQRHQLVGKLFNVSEETPRSSLADSSMFKNLITGGEMTVKKLYSQPYSTPNNCKFIFACNDLPNASDKTNGLFRRLLIAPFDASFHGDAIDRQIRQKLQAEASGILNRVVEGYTRLEKNDWNFTVSKKAEEEVETYKSEVDALGEWMQHNLAYDQTNVGSFAEDIYNMYVTDMELSGMQRNQVEHYTEFSRRIGPTLKVKLKDIKTRRRKDGRSVAFYKNVRVVREDTQEEQGTF